MGNPATLKPKPFTSENQPPGWKKSRKGIPNRATVYEKILNVKTKVKLPDGEVKTITVYEAIALGQAQSAMKGNTNAWKEIQDSLHGKLKELTEHSGTLDVTTRVIKPGE